jgi:hypothetical protein
MPRILVIDDEQLLRSTVVTILNLVRGLVILGVSSALLKSEPCATHL